MVKRRSIRARVRRQWDPAAMQTAIKFYNDQLKANSPVSIRDVAEKFCVPKSSLGDRLSGRVSTSPNLKPGPNPILSSDEESKKVDYVKVCAQIGFGRTKQQILSLVGDIEAKSQTPTKFKDGKPGQDWWSGFLKRWPQVKLCSPQSLPRERAIALNPNVVKNYFALLHDILVKYSLLDKPERIYNADETGMPLDPKPPKVVKLVGQDAHTQTSGNKTNITVVACASASGVLLPPQVIFKGKRGMDREMFHGLPPCTRVCISPNGWIDSELFETWVTEHFVKHIPPARPVLLLIDGHSTHVRLDVARRCRENGIILFALPPHTTHKLQPLDRGCFKPLKDNFRREANVYMNENPGKFITRFMFGKIFGKVYTRSLSPLTIINSFSKCGIYPYNPKVILESTDLAPSLVGNVEAQITCISDVDKALEAMGVFDPTFGPTGTDSSIERAITDPQPGSSTASSRENESVSHDLNNNPSLSEGAVSLLCQNKTTHTSNDDLIQVPLCAAEMIPNAAQYDKSENANAAISNVEVYEASENANATISNVEVYEASEYANDAISSVEVFQVLENVNVETIHADQLVSDTPCTENIQMVSSESIVDCSNVSCVENACFVSPTIAQVTQYIQQDHPYTDALNEITIVSNPDITCNTQCTSSGISQAVESTLNESLCGLLDKSKELAKSVKSKKCKVVVNARALTEDEWFRKAEEEERKKVEIEEEKERRRKVRVDKKREKEALKIKKEASKGLTKPKSSNKKPKREIGIAKRSTIAKQTPRARQDVALMKAKNKPVQCPHCDGTFLEETEVGIERLWVQCCVCQLWMHGDDCLPIGFYANAEGSFRCPDCWN